jgi:hippurate hydrolase
VGAAWTRDVARRLAGDDAVVESPSPVMGAEDWSYVLERVPGAMAFLGMCPEGADPAKQAANHSNLMMMDEGAMSTGIALHAAIALDFLGAET